MAEVSFRFDLKSFTLWLFLLFDSIKWTGCQSFAVVETKVKKLHLKKTNLSHNENRISLIKGI